MRRFLFIYVKKRAALSVSICCALFPKHSLTKTRNDTFLQRLLELHPNHGGDPHVTVFVAFTRATGFSTSSANAGGGGLGTTGGSGSGVLGLIFGGSSSSGAAVNLAAHSDDHHKV